VLAFNITTSNFIAHSYSRRQGKGLTFTLQAILRSGRQ